MLKDVLIRLMHHLCIQMEAEADGTSVMDALYANKASLETIFNIIDADHSGALYGVPVTCT